MNEKLFQFIWKHRLYATAPPLTCTEGRIIQVIQPGILNSNEGPDFLEAKIRIGDTLWAGHIELHLKSSDWNKHHHQQNSIYDRIILHVVNEHDNEEIGTKQQSFPTLVLGPHINTSLLDRYTMLMNTQGFVPCERFIHEVRPLVISQQLDRMLFNRLEKRISKVEELLHRLTHNWQEVFYILLAGAYGLHINQDPFERLALQTPLPILAKHKNQLLQLEALLLGQAGLLQDYYDDPYAIQLQNEYAYLKKLYSLQGLERSQWNFLRLRPANFPTLRIAQFAQLLHQSSHLFSKILECNSIYEVRKLFEVNASDYWKEHYTLTERANNKHIKPGKLFIDTIIINVVVPTLYIYGLLNAKEIYKQKALEWLRLLPAEKNAVINEWKKLGIGIHNAEDTQALLELKKQMCNKKKCLDCAIGYNLLK